MTEVSEPAVMPPSTSDAGIHHGTAAFRRTNLALFAAGFATFGVLYCVQPLMPQFSADYGVDEATSALSLSLTTGVLAFALLFAGALSDRWGRKPIMTASIVASALLLLLTALAPTWGTFLLLRTLLGLTLSGLPAVAMTYLSEELDNQSIGLGMGLYISGSAVGGMGGRLITGVLTDSVSWRVGVAVVALTALLAGWLFARNLPPSRHFVRQPLQMGALSNRFGGVLRDPGLPWMFAEGGLLLGAFVTVYNYLGYRLLAPPYNLSQTVVGLIFGIYVVGMFSSPWMGHLAGKLGRRKVLWTAVALMLTGALLTLSQSLVLIMLGIVALTFGFFGGHSIVSSWVGRRAGSAKAQASSLYLCCYYVGSSVAGWAGGLFYASHGWNGVGAFVGLMVAAALLIAWRLYRLPPLAGPPSPGTEPALP